MRVVSRGLRVSCSAEFSVAEPIANSSRFIRPKRTAPDALRRSVTPAS
jgi:hypothetical protein